MTGRQITPEMAELLVQLDDAGPHARVVRHKNLLGSFFLVQGDSRKWSPRTIAGLARRGELVPEIASRDGSGPLSYTRRLS